MASKPLLYTGRAVTGLLMFALVSAMAFVVPTPLWAQRPPQPHIEQIYVPDDLQPPPGASTLAVQVTNLGGPATMGTITVSSSDDTILGLTFGEPGVTILGTADETCYPQPPAVRLYGPGTTCLTASRYPPCSGKGRLAHSMAELVWGGWPTGVGHTIWVDVYPRPGATLLRWYD
jgi:hypothetical protein